jgi:deoxyribonuclease V
MPLHAALDVHYRDNDAVAAAVLFREWTDRRPAGERHAIVDVVAPADGGQDVERELPCLLAVLDKIEEPLTTVLVDGYVWLADERPGLGSHLYEALGKKVPIIGLAKNPFEGARRAIPVMRGGSRKALYITTVGIDANEAAELVLEMHGDHRIPTLLKRVDALCREPPSEA